ncbi:hypothetical protein SCHPADRAFT_947467 [Schizopora paradoxa]|uniref:Uncharacterized protein n=1 Tax=Schizopora paradoxa TaxID=27342 RepID=A0A0H2R5J4_9AGAM|nr:hypothetical protein SCHPADRAFT_947467 [Schizopora paradoxa]
MQNATFAPLPAITADHYVVHNGVQQHVPITTLSRFSIDARFMALLSYHMEPIDPEEPRVHGKPRRYRLKPEFRHAFESQASLIQGYIIHIASGGACQPPQLPDPENFPDDAAAAMEMIIPNFLPLSFFTKPTLFQRLVGTKQTIDQKVTQARNKLKALSAWLAEAQRRSLLPKYALTRLKYDWNYPPAVTRLPPWTPPSSPRLWPSNVFEHPPLLPAAPALNHAGPFNAQGAIIVAVAEPIQLQGAPVELPLVQAHDNLPLPTDDDTHHSDMDIETADEEGDAQGNESASDDDDHVVYPPQKGIRTGGAPGLH